MNGAAEFIEKENSKQHASKRVQLSKRQENRDSNQTVFALDEINEMFLEEEKKSQAFKKELKERYGVLKKLDPESNTRKLEVLKQELVSSCDAMSCRSPTVDSRISGRKYWK